MFVHGYKIDDDDDDDHLLNLSDMLWTVSWEKSPPSEECLRQPETHEAAHACGNTDKVWIFLRFYFPPCPHQNSGLDCAVSLYLSSLCRKTTDLEVQVACLVFLVRQTSTFSNGAYDAFSVTELGSSWAPALSLLICVSPGLSLSVLPTPGGCSATSVSGSTILVTECFQFSAPGPFQLRFQDWLLGGAASVRTGVSGEGRRAHLGGVGRWGEHFPGYREPDLDSSLRKTLILAWPSLLTGPWSVKDSMGMEENTDAYELNSSLGVCGYICLASQICLSLGFTEK